MSVYLDGRCADCEGSGFDSSRIILKKNWVRKTVGTLRMHHCSLSFAVMTVIQSGGTGILVGHSPKP